jgi:hypothetical protein
MMSREQEKQNEQIRDYRTIKERAGRERKEEKSLNEETST